MLSLVTLLIIDLIYQNNSQTIKAKSSVTDTCISDAKGCLASLSELCSGV